MATIELDDRQYDALMTLARQRGLSVDALLAEMLDSLGGQGDLFPGIVHLLSHDLRTPLATVMSSSDLIKHYHDRLSDERLVEHLNTIQYQVRQIDGSLDNLTVLLKLRLGLLVFDPVTLDPIAFCQTVIQRILDSVDPVPEIALRNSGTSEVIWDQPLLRLALSNLLVNAVKFSPALQPVHLLLRVEPDHCRIEVQDSGIGIPAEALDRLGDPFFRASNVRDLPGHGLGLMVVKQIVDLHRGELTIDSELDSGTQVVMTLPNGVRNFSA